MTRPAVGGAGNEVILHNRHVELSEDLLRARAGEQVFSRGENYVRCVHGLQVTDTGARGSVQARRVYRVELD